MKKLLAALGAAFLLPICAIAQVNQGGGGGAVQNPTANGGGAALPHVQQMIGGKGNGDGVSMPEKGIVVSGTQGTVAWADDLNGGTYDPRDPRWAGGIYGSTPAAAAQAMSNQMACDLAMGLVKHARANWPQGNFPVDQLLIAPGSTWEGVATSQGGTFLYTNVNNHFAAKAPNTMTVTCSDGNSHTDSLQQARVAHFTFGGCAVGGCSNASGDTGSYAEGGPGNTGLEMSGSGNVAEFVYAQNFGGYGIRIDGQDSKAFHNTLYNDLMWYYFGGYKGVGESAASPEVSAVTTGSSGSVSLSWAAVTGAAGYVIYRGTSAGNESVWYTANSNSFTDTGTTGLSGTVTNVVTQTTAAAPGTITATPSTTGGTLAAGTYFYKVTSFTADGWHGSIEFAGLDVMADWVEAYGLFDAPTIYTYHHLADILLGGGDSHFDHLWPQLGQVGISQPFGTGAGDIIENFRVDFARLEGIFVQDQGIGIRDGIIDGSCTAANAATINTGQVLPQYAGTCNQLLATGLAPNIANVQFADNNGFGPTQKTADVLITDSVTGTAVNVTGSYQFISADGVLSGIKFTPSTIALTNVTGPTPNVQGLWQINPNDSTPTSYTNFTRVQNGQDLYIAGGNSNVTIKNNPPFIYTCTGTDINLGTISPNTFLHFLAHSGNSVIVHEVCQDAGNTGGGVSYPSATTTHLPAASITGGVTSLVDTAFSDDTTNTHDSEPFYLVGEYQQATGTANSSNNYVSNVTNWLVSYWNGTTAVTASWNVYAWVAQGASPPASVLTYYAPAGLTSTAVLYAIDPGLLATSSINYNSPKFKTRGNCWNGSTATLDDWNWQGVVGAGANPTETLQFVHSGCSGKSQVEMPGLLLDGAPLIGSGTASNSDIVGELAFSAATTASYTWANTYTSHPECTFDPQFSTTVARWVTYTSTTSFTINFASAVTGSVSYICLSRN